MRTCQRCGFENAPEGGECPLCGQLVGSGMLRGSDDTPTVGLPVGTPTPTPGSGGGRSRTYPAGHVYGGRFRIEGLLGRGGMGAVYRVHDLTEKRDLALKILLPSEHDEADGVERFQREIEMLSRIRHPGVPRVYGWGTNGEERFFVCELIDGKTLREAITASGPWPATKVAELGSAVADALQAAHQLGIVHRDVKPHNVMLATDGTIRLLDFGVARGVGLDMKTITKTGMIVGTPEYMSPEQLDSHRVDERSDIYSLGVVLFEAATGRLPFAGATPIAVAMQHMSETPPALRSVRPDVPAWLEKIVLRCLEKSPLKRFESAAELAVELRRPRSPAATAQRRLPNGDVVVEDAAGSTDWALVLATHHDRGWQPGAALRFEDRFYKLVEATAPPAGGRPVWTYRFVFWPSSEIFRGLVDYDASARSTAAEHESLASKLRKWIPGAKG